MNWVDFIILIVVLLFAIEGMKRGLFVQLFDILGFATALLASLNFYPLAAGLLLKLFNLPKIAASPVGFLLVWLITETLFFTVFSPALRKIFTSYGQKAINIYLGFLPAIVNALLLCAFVLLFVISLPIKPEIKKDVFDSKIGSALVEKATVLERPFNSVFGPIAKQGLTFLTVSPDEKECLELGFTQKEHSIDTSSQIKMLELVNKERVERGFKPLTLDESLTQVAANHSEDMLERGYFCHFSPEGEDVGDRLDGAGLSYTIAGENLALAPGVTRAHDGLMNSSGHRRNILDPVYSKIGIGAVDGGVYGKMFTQIFTN